MQTMCFSLSILISYSFYRYLVCNYSLIFYLLSKNSSSRKTPFLIPRLVMHKNLTANNIESFDSSNDTVERIQTNEQEDSDFVINLKQSQVNECLEFASTANERCYDLIKSEGWEFVKVNPQGETISCKTEPDPVGKICKLTGTLNISPATFMRIAYDEVEKSPSWNEDISEAKKIHIIDERTDIVYQATASLASGAISPRDFVFLRHKGQYESYMTLSMKTADSIDIPERDDHVRAEFGFSCLAARNLTSGDENKSYVTWIFNPHLKGWIPNYVVNLFIPTFMTDYTKALRKYLSTYSN